MRIILNLIGIVLLSLVQGCGKTYLFDVSAGNPYQPRELRQSDFPLADNQLLMYHMVKNEEKYGIKELLDKLIIAVVIKRDPNYRASQIALLEEGLEHVDNDRLIVEFRNRLIKLTEEKYSSDKLAKALIGEFRISYTDNIRFNELSLKDNSYTLPPKESDRNFGEPLIYLPVIVEGIKAPEISLPFNNELQQSSLVLLLKGKIGRMSQNWYRGVNTGSIESCEITEVEDKVWDLRNSSKKPAEVNKRYVSSCRFKPTNFGVVFMPNQVINYYFVAGKAKIK